MPLQWVQKPNPPWSARSWHASAATPDGKIWVLGGFQGTTCYNDVWYTTDGETWTQATSSAGWSKRCGHQAVVTPDGRLWVTGGFAYSASSEVNDVWYSTNGVTWTQATSSALWDIRRDFGAAVTPDGKIWVMGGCSYTRGKGDRPRYFADCFYSTNGSTWTQTQDVCDWDGRMGFACLSTSDGKIWVIGGYRYDGVRPKDVWYSTNGSTWIRVTATAPWKGRNNHAALVDDEGKIWIFGGYDGTNYLNDIWYTSDGASWTRDTSSAPWSARNSHTAARNDLGIFILGGHDGTQYLNDVWYSSQGVYILLAATKQVVSNSVSLTAASKLAISTPVSIEAAVKVYVDEPGVQRTVGVPKVNHRGHYVIAGEVTAYGRLPGQFGEALIYDYMLSSVESRFAAALEVTNEVSSDSALQIGVYNQTEEEATIGLAVYNPAETTVAAEFVIHNPVETAASIKLYAYNPVSLSIATRQIVSNAVETAGRVKLSIGTPKSSSSAARLEVWNTTEETFVVRVDVQPGFMPVEYSYALNVKIGTPASMQAATKQRVYNTKTSAYSTRQTIYTRVTYTAATQQRVLAVSPWSESFALAVAVYNQQTAEGRVSVETVPTGKGEGVLEYTVIPPDASACVDIAAGHGLVIERMPGTIKATYRGPDGSVELVANYAWQAGIELPIAFRWTPAGCALFVAKAKRAESAAPMLIGERIADIQTGNAQYKDIRVSIRAREDWELAQDIRAVDQDTLVFASQPSQAQVQFITPTVFTQGSLLSVYPHSGMEYCVYEGEDGWLKLDYNDSDWDEAVLVKMEDIADYIWSPGGSRFMYYREKVYPYNISDAVYLWIKSQDAVFTVYVNGVAVLQGTQSGYEYNWSCVFQDKPKPGLFGKGWNILSIKAEATGSNPGIRYLLIGRSGFETYPTAYSRSGDTVIGREKPVWGGWKAVEGPVMTVDPGKALRFRSPDGRPVRLLNWKDEEESIVRVNLTPVGR